MLEELAEYGPEIIGTLATIGSALGIYKMKKTADKADVPWYYGFLAGADALTRPILASQRLKVQRREWQKRPDARTIAVHTHSRNSPSTPDFPTDVSDEDIGSFDAHQGMTDIAKVCREGVVECVLMTEHNLLRDGAEKEIEWAKELEKKYKTKFLIGSEIGTSHGTAGGHVIYVPSKQDNALDFLENWESTDEWPGPVKLAEMAYDNDDFIMIPHPGKGKYYDAAEDYLKIKWRLKRKDIDELVYLARSYDMILPIASANSVLPNAELRANQIMLREAWNKDHVREFYENDAHWMCDLQSAVIYGKFSGQFTGRNFYEMLKKKRYEQVFADTDALNRPWGKNIHMANHLAQIKLLLSGV